MRVPEVWAAPAMYTVFSMAREAHSVDQAPLLERAAHPGRRYSDEVRAALGEQAADLGEADVIAGHHPDAEAADIERRQRPVSRPDRGRLSEAGSVVEVDLPVGRDGLPARTATAVL